MTIIKIIGIAIVVVSFIFILRRPDQSLMDALMKKRKKEIKKHMKSEEDKTK